MARKKKYEPEYPYTLFGEAVDIYRAEVLKDEVSRNKFLTHIQDLVEKCTRRKAGLGGRGVSEKIDDIVGFVNVCLLESWLPKYLSSKPNVKGIPSAVKYLTVSIGGYVKKFMAKHQDPRTVPAEVMEAMHRSSKSSDDKAEIAAIYERRLREHLVLRSRKDLDIDVVEKLMRHLAWEEYRKTK